jgi:hypothetical protein
MLTFSRTFVLLAVLSRHSVCQNVIDSPRGLLPAELALRERVVQFYQFHIDGKYPRAYEYVALDSRARFYSAQKPRLVSFKITYIEFSKSDPAQALVVIESRQRIFSANRPWLVTEGVPITTWWKFEDGEWQWYREADPPAKQSRLAPIGGL